MRSLIHACIIWTALWEMEKAGEKQPGIGKVRARRERRRQRQMSEWMIDWTEADWGRSCWEQRWKGRKLPGPWRSTPLCFLLPTVTLLSNSWNSWQGRPFCSVGVCVYVCVGNSRELLLLLDRILYWLVGLLVGTKAGNAKQWTDGSMHASEHGWADGGRRERVTSRVGLMARFPCTMLYRPELYQWSRNNW